MSKNDAFYILNRHDLIILCGELRGFSVDDKLSQRSINALTLPPRFCGFYFISMCRRNDDHSVTPCPTESVKYQISPERGTATANPRPLSYVKYGSLVGGRQY